MEGINTAEEQIKTEREKNSSPIKSAPATPVVTPAPKPFVEKPKETPKPTKEEEEDKTMKNLCDKLTVLKERGNTHYKRQSYKDAIKVFSEAINTFEAAGAPLTDSTVKTVVTQLMTNRSLSFHLLNQQASALTDATYVLTKLDPTNAKALFRRAHSYKSQEKWELAARDL